MLRMYGIMGKTCCGVGCLKRSDKDKFKYQVLPYTLRKFLAQQRAERVVDSEMKRMAIKNTKERLGAFVTRSSVFCSL